MALDMNPGIRAQWCAALRSGDYQQAMNTLRTQTGYCCLGVLTDLYLKAGNPEVYETGDDSSASVWDADTLTGPVEGWAGLGRDNPWLDGGPGKRKRAGDWNDEGATFPEIADLIDGGVTS